MTGTRTSFHVVCKTEEAEPELMCAAGILLYVFISVWSGMILDRQLHHRFLSESIGGHRDLMGDRCGEVGNDRLGGFIEDFLKSYSNIQNYIYIKNLLFFRLKWLRLLINS